MRIGRVVIENFRAARNVVFKLSACNCLVGDNGAGKSTLLSALNVFFQHSRHSRTDTGKLSKEDFTDRDVSTPIRITVTFCDLSKTAADDFQHYVRHGQLTITAEAALSEGDGFAKVTHFGERLAIKQFAPFFEAVSAKAKVADQKVIYAEIRRMFPDLPVATTGKAMVDGLRQYEESHSTLCELMPSSSDFYGCVTAGGRLSAHVKWVYIPPVHDASDEQSDSARNAFNDLLQLTVSRSMGFDERVREIAEKAMIQLDEIALAQSSALAELQSSLQKSIVRFGPPDTVLKVAWDTELGNLVTVRPPFAKTSLGDGRFLGEVARQGHAVQRAYISSLLHQLADSEASGPTLILGFEEPELFQHPPQVRRLTRTVRELAVTGQVLLTTHNPAFVSLEDVESIQLIRRCETNGFKPCTATSKDIEIALDDDKSKKSRSPHDYVLSKLTSVFTPSLAEMFFSRFAVFLEGVEDLAILGVGAELSDRRPRLEAAEINFFPVNGKDELEKAFAIAKAFGIPSVVVYDNDSRHRGTKDEAQTIRKNRRLQKLGGLPVDQHEDFPPSSIARGTTLAWDDDIQQEIRAAVSENAWDDTVQAIGRRMGIGNFRKNTRVLGEAVCEMYQQSEALEPIERMLDAIIDLACGKTSDPNRNEKAATASPQNEIRVSLSSD